MVDAIHVRFFAFFGNFASADFFRAFGFRVLDDRFWSHVFFHGETAEVLEFNLGVLSIILTMTNQVRTALTKH
jgi:hypothetical protein